MDGTTARLMITARRRSAPPEESHRAASGGVGSRARCALAVVVAGGLVFAAGGPAAGVAKVLVAPRPGVVYMSSGTSLSTRLSAGTRTGSSLSFSPVGAGTPGGAAHQGLASKASDGRLYAVEISDGQADVHLVVLDAAGAITRLGALASLAGQHGTVTGGTFGEGVYSDTYLAVVADVPDAGGRDVLLAVDIAADGTFAETMTPLDLPDGARLGDLAPSGGYLWGVHGQTIVRVDPVDGSATAWTLPEGTVGPGTGTVFGVAWSTGDGQLAFGSHAHGEITEIAVSDQASATPTFEVVARHSTPIGPQSDGTFVPSEEPAEIPSEGAPTIGPRQPSAPEIDPTDGNRFTGHGVPGDTIAVTFPDGSTSRTTVEQDGGWVVQPPAMDFVHGHLVEATATDLTGTTSETSCTTVDLFRAQDPVADDVAERHLTSASQRGGHQ